MFFTRLRRRAKWVFLLLAVVFALGFVGFGVGAQGAGIGDYIRDLFGLNSSSSGTPSVDEARQKVAENPSDPQAHRDLAVALQTSGQFAAAIPELEAYVEARPNDVEALQQLASLLGARADQQRQAIAVAQSESNGASLSSELPSGGAADQIFGGRITDFEEQEGSSRLSTLVQQTTATYAKQADTYRKLAAVQPNEPSNYLQLGQSEYLAGDTQAAITAWERFVKLAPDDPNAPLIKRELRRLRQSTQGAGG